MKEYKIPVWWSVGGIAHIDADSLEEAIKLADDMDLDLVDDVDYIDGSFEVNEECAAELNRGK